MSIVRASKAYLLDARRMESPPVPGCLAMGSRVNPAGGSLGANRFYLLRNGQPYLPVMGEFHYSRYPRALWEDALLQIQAGGVDIVSSYVFWIHHEEIEREWEWGGNKDLRGFLALCASLGLEMFLRIGPWCHGECRNGGFPDWLLTACAARTNDSTYFEYVQRYFGQIFTQAEGMMFKDGGPIIGVQIENEFMHCGGSGGGEHMLTLKRLAIDAGFDVPFYTATGWGGSPIPEGEFLPVQGGYVDAPWEPGCEPLPPSPHFMFQRGIAPHAFIGSDLAKEPFSDIQYRAENYPLCTAELGPGNQIKRNRRPIISPKDASALPVMKLASGANLIGYYMYHGGSNPMGKLCTLEEPGYSAINYDFQTAISEYGRPRLKHRLLRRLHMFLKDFGATLAPMRPQLPKRTPNGPEDVETLRFMVRAKEGSGFIFLNNHQRGVKTTDLECHVRLLLPDETLFVPRTPLLFPRDAVAIWPFNMNVGGTLLKYATAQPLAVLDVDGDAHYFFFAIEGVPVEYAFAAKSVARIRGDALAHIQDDHTTVYARGLDGEYPGVLSLTTFEAKEIRIHTLSEHEALRFYKGRVFGRERALVSPADMLFRDGAVELRSIDSRALFLSVFPAFEGRVDIDGMECAAEQEGDWARYSARVSKRTAEVNVESLGTSRDGKYLWRLTLSSDVLDNLHDVFLHIRYRGDEAQLLLDGRVVADELYYGPDWEVSVKRFAPEILCGELVLAISPLARDAAVCFEEGVRPDFSETDALAELVHVKAVPVYSVRFEALAGDILSV